MKRPKPPLLSDSLRAWAQDERSRLAHGPPTDRELRDYLDGVLEESRQLEIEELVVLDPATSNRILELGAQRQHGERPESPPTEEEKAAHWRSIQKALEDAPSLSSSHLEASRLEGNPVESVGPARPLRGRRPELVKWLAAGWAATAVILSSWILRLETKPEEGAFTQASQSTGPPFLTEAPRRLELSSRETLTRSQAQDPVSRISRSAGVALLALVPDHFDILKAYRASIRVEGGRSFEPEPVSRRAGGGFFLRLEVAELPAGSYEIVLEGRQRDDWQVLGVYPLELKP